VSWLILWMLSTRIGSTTIVSANSEAQLRSVTWAEITKWAALLLNSHWFEISATRVMPAKWIAELVERDLKVGTRYWSVEGRLWSEENPDSYAGVHNQAGVMVIFDEASGIPDSIWSVTAGFFTENTPHRFWLAFSNPRRNEGYFFEAFHAKRNFWQTQNIDAREVEDTDKGVYEQIIAEYGADSKQAKVEVYGQFPALLTKQFLAHATKTPTRYELSESILREQARIPRSSWSEKGATWWQSVVTTAKIRWQRLGELLMLSKSGNPRWWF
jgi:hypothetical protein